MSKTRIRVIALLLALITAVSVTSSLTFTATAATNTSSSTNDKTDDDDEGDLDEDDDEKLFYVEDESDVEFETDGQYWKDAAGEVIYEMIYRCIDHLAESSWVGSVFAMGGLVVFKSIYDAINPKNNEPSPDTKLILDAVNELSNKISANHNEAMNAFEELNLNVSTQSFRKSVDALIDGNEQVIDSLKQYGVKTDSKEKGVISKSQYNAYKKALGQSKLDFSHLEQQLTSMINFLKGVKYENELKPGYISYIDYLLSKVNAKNSSHTFTKAVDLRVAAKGMKKEIKSMQGTCLLYATTLTTIAHLEYKIDEYEQKEAEAKATTKDEKEEAADLKEQMVNTRDERLKQIKSKTDDARKFYKKAVIYLNKVGVAELEIDGKVKSFPTFGDAWGTGYNSAKKFKIKLIRNVKADASRGLNDAGLGDEYGFNNQGGLILNDNKEATIDFNNRKVDCSSKAFTFCTLDKNNSAKLTLNNGTIKNATRITHNDTDSANDKVVVTLNKMNILDTANTAFFFKCYGGSIEINNSTVKGTKKGCGIYSQRTLEYRISNSTFENNNGTYGGAIATIYDTRDCYIKNSKFIGNVSETGGGAIRSGSNLSYPITDTIFKNNKAKEGDGGAFTYYGTFKNCTFEGNSASRSGGAVYAYNDIKDCTFKNNKADKGGAVGVWFSNKTIENCNFEGNNSTGDGGAVYFKSDLGGSQVSNSTFKDNKAGGDGGAICACAHTDLTLKDSTLTYNEASNNGGGVYLGALNSADHVFNNDTITNNNANGHGGGIYANTMTAAAADIRLYETVIIKDNHQGSKLAETSSYDWVRFRVFRKRIWSGGKDENAYMVQAAGKKAMFYTKDEYKKGTSCIYISSSTNSDIAVVDLSWKDHEPTFHADRGRRIYRGSLHNYTMYLDSWSGGSLFTTGTIALIAGGAALLLAAAAAIIIVVKKKKKHHNGDELDDDETDEEDTDEEYEDESEE